MDLQPHAWIRPDSLCLPIAFLSSCDSKRCPAHDALVRLHEQAGAQADPLASVAADGDRLLYFGWRRPDLDRDGLALRLHLIGAVGPTWHQSTRLWPLAQTAGVLFLPSPVEGYQASGREQAGYLPTYLEAGIPLAIAWLLGSGRPEREPDELGADFALPAAPTYVARRDTGVGLRAALDCVVEQALDAYAERRLRPVEEADVAELPSQLADELYAQLLGRP